MSQGDSEEMDASYTPGFADNESSASQDEYFFGNFDFSHFSRAYKIYGYACCVIFPTGIILNLLCIVILVKIKMYQSSVGIHLVWIAVIDLFTMISGIAISYPLQEMLGIPQDQYWGNIICRLATTFSYPLARASSLLMTSATIERFLSIAFTLKVKQWPMFLISKVIVGTVIFLCLCECVIWSVLYSEKNCWYSPVADTTFKTIYQKTYVIFYTTTAVIVLIFTTLIAIFLFNHQKKMKSMKNDSVRSGGQQGKEARITFMLFVVAVTFLLSTLSEFTGFMSATYSGTQTEVDVWTSAWALLILYDLYHSTNFIIYVIFLEKFRNCFVGCFRRNQGQGGAPVSRSRPTSTQNSSLSDQTNWIGTFSSEPESLKSTNWKVLCLPCSVMNHQRSVNAELPDMALRFAVASYSYHFGGWILGPSEPNVKASFVWWSNQIKRTLRLLFLSGNKFSDFNIARIKLLSSQATPKFCRCEHLDAPEVSPVSLFCDQCQEKEKSQIYLGITPFPSEPAGQSMQPTRAHYLWHIWRGTGHTNISFHGRGGSEPFPGTRNWTSCSFHSKILCVTSL